MVILAPYFLEMWTGLNKVVYDSFVDKIDLNFNWNLLVNQFRIILQMSALKLDPDF